MGSLRYLRGAHFARQDHHHHDVAFLREWQDAESELGMAASIPLHSTGGASGSVAGTHGSAPAASLDEADELICEPCSEPLAAPVDTVPGGAVEPSPAPKESRKPTENPELLAKREQELSPADLVEKRRLIAEAATVRHKMTHLPQNKWCPACMMGKMVLTPN